MEKRKIELICETDCTGCGACSNICPVSAIHMCENKEGFLVPRIEDEKCIDCGLCERHCPVLTNTVSDNRLIAVYAAAAKESIRLKSSSGGIFTVLAEKILENGGWVCGASFKEDYMGVSHIIVHDKDGLEHIRGSKYVQSETGYIFQTIKELLQLGKKVLFSGCPCQVAGIKAFLGRDYDNLITIDLICHGVPSPKAYRKFIKSEILKAYPNKNIEELSFRNKEQWGWSPSLYAKISGGYEYSKSKNETSWYTGFLNILNCRKSCGNCKFNKMPRQGDITLGDFWGIEETFKEWNDGLGINVVTINNEKGNNYFEAAKHQIEKLMETTIEKAVIKNGNLVASSKEHPNRERFFKLLNQYNDYTKITEYSIKRKFDIGLVGWWYGRNYGSVLTNYALEQYLESQNYSVLMLEWPEKVKQTGKIQDSFARRFANKHYEISIRRTYEELPDLNWFCDIFIVGSDQLWNYWSTKENGGYFFLDFVSDSKKKIAYATSFGHPTYGAPQHILAENAFFMNRFDAVSVREQDGVKICKDTFGVDAVCTIDPVFLCEEDDYNKIIEHSNVNETRRYIFAYILTPSKEKRDAILEISEKMGMPVVLILDAQEKQEENKQIMNMPMFLKEDIELEDWLYYIKNADFILTDSYHGLCFSLIFHINFICFANIKRGLSRFITLLNLVDLNNHLVFDPKDAVQKKLYKKKIYYDEVWKRLQPQIAYSKEWLCNALTETKVCCESAYDILWKRLKALENRVGELEKKNQ